MIVWYCDDAFPVAPSFSLKAWKGVLTVPVFCVEVFPAPKPPVDAPKPPAVFVLVEPNPPLVLPPPNKPPPPVAGAPKPVGLAWPNRLPPVLAVLDPNAGVVVALLLLAPKLPKALLEAPPPPPNRPPPVDPPPKGVEPKVVLLVLAPNPPEE